MRFFHALDRVVQAEPWLDRDRAIIDHLRTIGIEKGKTFDPDPATQQILGSAIDEARAFLDAKYERIFQPFNEGKQWALPALPEMIQASEANFNQPDAYPIDLRGVTYSFAFFSSKHLGKGQFYLMTLKDSDGAPLDGSLSYRLTVPADAPVSQYWSAVAYDRATHTLIRNVAHAGRSGLPRKAPNST